MKRFRMTSEHLALLRRMYVGWQDCETGAPEIDPKRPYGNSSVEIDVAEILGLVKRGEEITDSQRDYCAALHRETDKALEVVLRTGKFEVGEYVCDDYHANWRSA